MAEEWIPLAETALELMGYYLIVFMGLIIAKHFIAPIINYIKDIKVAKIRANNPEPEQIITYLMEPNKVETKSFFANFKINTIFS